MAASNKIVIELNFFASYHGHSICDAHAGVSKRAIKWAKLREERIRNPLELAIFLQKSLSRTTAMPLPKNFNKITQGNFKIERIRDYHQLRCTPTEGVICNRQTKNLSTLQKK